MHGAPMQRIIAPLLLVILASAATAQTADWKQPWDELLAAARKEGKVVVSGPPSQELRQALPAAFKERSGSRWSTWAAAAPRSPPGARRAGGRINTMDLMISGIQTMATILYREKMLDPLRPALVLPEVTDGSKGRWQALVQRSR